MNLQLYPEVNVLSEVGSQRESLSGKAKVIDVNIRSTSDFTILQEKMLDQVCSSWPAGWDQVIDQFCREDLNYFFDEMLIVLNLTKVISFQDVSHLLVAVATIDKFVAGVKFYIHVTQEG